MNQKNLQWLSFSKFLSSYSENVINFLLPLITYKSFESIQESGMIVALHVGSRLLGYPISGLICDQIGESRLLSITSYIRALFYFLIFSALAPGTADQKKFILVLMNLLAIGDGFAGGVSQIAFESMGPKLYPGEQFRSYQALIQTAEQGALLLAPLSGALLLGAIGKQALFGLMGGLFVLSGLALLPLRIESCPLSFARRSSAHHLKSSVATLLSPLFMILKDRVILITLILTLLDNLLLGLYGAMSAPLGLGLFHKTEQNLGWVVTLSYFISLGAIYYSHSIHKKISTFPLLKGSYFAAYFGFFLLGIAPDFFSFALALILIESSCAAGVFALRVLRADCIPSRDFGKVSGVLTLFQQVTLPLGGMIVAMIHQPGELQQVMLNFTGILALFTFGLFLWMSAEVRSQEVQT